MNALANVEGRLRLLERVSHPRKLTRQVVPEDCVSSSVVKGRAVVLMEACTCSLKLQQLEASSVELDAVAASHARLKAITSDVAKLSEHNVTLTAEETKQCLEWVAAAEFQAIWKAVSTSMEQACEKQLVAATKRMEASCEASAEVQNGALAGKSWTESIVDVNDSAGIIATARASLLQPPFASKLKNATTTLIQDLA